MTGKSYTAGTAEAQAAAGKVGFIIGNDGRVNSRTPYSVQNVITKEGKECFILYNPITGKSRHAKRVFIPHEQPETAPAPTQVEETTTDAEKAEKGPKSPYKTAEEITAAFIADGWTRPTFKEATPEIYKKFSRPGEKKLFIMVESGNIYDDRGKIYCYNIPAKKPDNSPEPERTTEPTPAPEKGQDGPKTGPTEGRKKRYVFRTFTGWTVYDGITSESTISAATDAEAEEIARTLAAGRAYSVNRLWTAEEDAPETTQTQMDTASPEETAGDNQTPMEDGGKAGQPADDQTAMDSRPADGQTVMDGGKAGDSQTVMDGPEKGRNKPDKAEPLQTTTHDDSGPKTGKETPYTAPPELSTPAPNFYTISTRGSPISAKKSMRPGQGCGKIGPYPFMMWISQKYIGILTGSG